MTSSNCLGVDLLSYPEKFDIALKLGPLREAIKVFSTTQLSINECLHLSYTQPDYHMSDVVVKKAQRTDIIVSSLTQAYWINNITGIKLSQMKKISKNLPNITKIFNAWTEIIQYNLGHIFSSIPQQIGVTLSESLNECLNSSKSNNYLYLATVLYQLDRKIINQHKHLTKQCQAWIGSPHPREELKPIIVKCEELNFELRMGWDFGILRIKDHNFALDRDSFLLWVNKLGELACALIYTLVQPMLFKETGPEKLCNLLRLCSKVMLRPTRRGDWDNQIGFSFPKSLEAIGVGMIISIEDRRKGWDNDVFLLNTLEGLIEDNVINAVDGESTDIYKFLSSLTSPEISELIGAVKLMGHPDIDLEAGLYKLHTRTHQDIHVDPQTIREARGYLLFEFCQRYYKRVGTWPPLVIPQTASYIRLRTVIEGGISPLSFEFTSSIRLSYEEWGYIDIQPCIENDYWESPLEFLKDTAISPQRESVWAYCLRNKLQPDETLKVKLKTMQRTRKYRLKDSNRLIIQFLLSDDLYWRSLEYRKKWAEIESIDDLQAEVETYWVIKLTPKEREMKVEGRFFGASPVCERDRRIQVEGVLAGMMKKMFPEQMLTATELEFNQKLIKFRNYRKLYPNHHVIQLCFDFQAWNNYMRKEFIDQGVGPVLDGIFNTHAYSRIMEFYERALIYCDCQKLLSAWEGQKGGIEGLNQATWTLATLTGLKVALSNLGYKFEVSVKGDDCRAAIMIPKNECPIQHLQIEADRVKQVLTDYCLNTGMHLKPEETFVSLSVIASSKQYQLDDIILPCGLKQALKMAHHSNTAFPTTQDLLSDIMSSCHSACFQTPFILTTWCSGVLVALLRVNFDHFFCKHLSQSMLVAFGLWPQVLGGPGILPLEVFIVRGENDLLSIVLSLYKFIFNCNIDPHLNQILWNIMCIPDKEEHHWKLLLSDPYSLNKAFPLTPSQFLKSSLRAQIKKLTRNPMLQSLLSRDTKEGEEYLIKTLVSLRPAHVKIMTAIYENSCFSVLDKVMARIDNSSSIFALLGAHKGYVRTNRGKFMLRKASKFHLAQVQWWLKILMLELDYRTIGFYGLDFDNVMRLCPTAAAQHAREQSWGIPIFSITYPSLTQQFSLVPTSENLPAEFLINVRPHCGIYHLVGVAQMIPQTNHDHPFFSSPTDVNPWIGGKTSTKTILPGYPLLHKSSALPKIESLLEIYARVVPLCPDLRHIIKWLVRMMVDLSDEDFGYLLPSVMGGSTAHRVPIQQYSMVTTPNFRHNLLQHVTRNYDRMLFTHQRLSRDYTLNFAAINIQHSFILACLRLFPSGPQHPQCFLAIPHQVNNEVIPSRFQKCDSCIADISDVPLMIQYDHPPDITLGDSSLIILPEVDKTILRESLNILAQQRQLNIMATLNVSLPGSAEYLRMANCALVNRMLVDSQRHQDELRVTVPGGLLSSSAIQALGITYQPFPMKILSWINPDWVVEFLMHDIILELLACYPKVDLQNCEVSAFRHKGLSSLILPILTYFTQASAHQRLSVAFHHYQRRFQLGEPMTGIDIMDVTSFTSWVYRIGIRYIQQQLPLDKKRHYSILSTHNESQALLLQQVQPKFNNIVQSAQNHSWQNYHRKGGSVLKGVFPKSKSPCEIWCKEGEHILKWFNDVLFGDEDLELKKWLYRACLVPLCLNPAIQDQQALLRYYHSPVPLPALRLGIPRLEVYEENHLAFASLNSFMGFDFYWYITGQCPHNTCNFTNDFLPFMELVIQNFIQNNHQPPLSNWWASWRIRVEEFADIQLNHMEEEAAMSEVALHPHRLGAFMAETQDRLQNPAPLNQLQGIRVDFQQRWIPTAVGAAPRDLISRDQLIIPQFTPLPFQWVNWNQHLRIRGYSGSAACKLWEILYQTRMLYQRDNFGVSLHLADGQGGFSTLIGRTFPNFEVYFNTLQTADSTPGGFPGDWLAHIPELDRLHCDLTETGDLCDFHETDTIIALCKHSLQRQEMTLITFDAERYSDEDQEDNINMLSNLAKIIGSLGGRNTVCIIKLFLVPWMLASSPILYLIDCCSQFRLIKPNSSRETNQEFYLVTSGVHYDYPRFPGLIHHRRKGRYQNALNRFAQNLNPIMVNKLRSIEHFLHPLMRNPAMPVISVKQIEVSLRLSPGTLHIRAHWDNNSIHHRLAEVLENTKRRFKGSALHQVTHGRRATAIGGVRFVKESTSQILRLRSITTLLNLQQGWYINQQQSFHEWANWLHSLPIQLALQDDFNKVQESILIDQIWLSCEVHTNCITSENSPMQWAHDPIHISLTHEFGAGCDIAVRIMTLGWIFTNTDQGDNVMNGLFRS